MENNQNSKSEPIEREFYVLTVDKLNKKSRIHTRETVLKWIEDLEKKEIPYYKIEYAINVPIEEVKNPFINDSLFCGAVVSYRDKSVEVCSNNRVSSREGRNGRSRIQISKVSSPCGSKAMVSFHFCPSQY